MTFDPTKPVQTRDGRPVRIIATDKAGAVYPVIALITEESGNESLRSYTAQGKYDKSGPRLHDADLVNVPERVTLFFDTDQGTHNPVFLRRANSKRIKVVLEGDKIISSEIVTL